VGTLKPMSHGSTFGGNPLACAAARASIRAIVDERLAERAERLGGKLRSDLASLGSPLMREVRGLGLLVGLELKVKVTPVLQRLQERHVLALPAGASVLRLLPPLVIEETDLDEVVRAIGSSLQEVEPCR